ncbi:alpha/beta hydrolase [Leifsonia sp. fls2-241-R2A-40a]|uniref:alpha/beta hydrolase n=1 Tax=Leifsonia sp. fls2-241-R2A-40a TaxID=3040290 RepID=UPI0025513473|nr:alpha/beta hydrolase [Leifsonia sp. fls2-241-R2A-40a]
MQHNAVSSVSAVTSAVSASPASVSVGSVSPSSVSPASVSLASVAGPVSDLPAGPAGRSTSAALLGAVAGLNSAALPSFLDANRAKLDALLVNPPTAVDVSRLWNLIDPDKQQMLIQAAPHVVGNLEGVPYDVRGRANSLDLKQTIASVTKTVKSAHGRAQRVALQRQLQTLNNVGKALSKHDGVTRTLVALDPSADAKASIVVGDLRTASYVSVLVPGMYMSVGEQIESWAKVAQEQYDLQTGTLRRILGPRGHGGAPGVAVVAWIGYQTPVLTNIGGTTLATQGADGLERTLEGIRALRNADQPYLSVFAHSYGSTAALMALERHTVTVDALALMGSPGSDAQSVAGLAVTGGNVFVGEAPMDPIVNSAFFGSDPGSPGYGAKPMGVGGAVDPITHVSLGGSSGHNEYFSPGTESMRNLAMIGIDRGELVIGDSAGSGGSAGETTQASAR